jgi:hypothetical protein
MIKFWKFEVAPLKEWRYKLLFMKYLVFFIFLFSCKPTGHINNEVGTEKVFHIHSSYTSFPDPARANGHLYDSVLYDAAGHYSDSSVLIFVPPKFSAAEKVNLVFWFHGWRNNIDCTNSYFELSRQFIASSRNAILVLAETAKNAPDSYGGKLERPSVFASLTNDIADSLKKQKVIGQNTTIGNITLAGHSGAYRVIAYILQNEGPSIHKVFLFDALYGEVDKFMNWVKEDPLNVFIHWYTNKGGGTDKVSEEMMQQLQMEKISFEQAEESTLTTEQVKKSRIVFIHSPREHSDIINKPSNFQLLLTALN